MEMRPTSPFFLSPRAPAPISLYSSSFFFERVGHSHTRTCRNTLTDICNNVQREMIGTLKEKTKNIASQPNYSRGATRPFFSPKYPIPQTTHFEKFPPLFSLASAFFLTSLPWQ
ncbi:hypothetical protein, unlikely [Trypanosoma brucei gambiense DAL972]|uniref:Uncharacterized protein n=1 Tax=Trypanosoma brucei gambiense (strain MHOM/CI/86/DAL972) TaxID=679716 RepID=D0A563_TRYB9|nr:hypothetical protein, unlikely [Trypanosoma brucei gambiense DAL972]CBH16407.1 hypothetical protein, unlikely [Trypanosoma brucei gambiense DAL972]|eukprot:XP_011778671.1 hypothetical protein, unlikely [Trypanosoma brucei gambiense DAL972]